MLGILDERWLRTDYTLTEVRVLFELGSSGPAEVPDLKRELGLDGGYLSRILGRFEEAGLVRRERTDRDARRQLVKLTAAGRRAFRTFDRRSATDVAALLERVPESRRHELVAAMRKVEDLLEGSREEPVLRTDLRPGDLGWIVERHGALYAQEFGFDRRFETLVARIAADFGDDLDPERERAWIAERGGERLGCVLCVRQDDETAKLRLLLVDPAARGAGLGGRLVDACVQFARERGYRRVVLWTQDNLKHAHRIYVRAGFEQLDGEPHSMFGPRVVGENWRLTL